MRRKTLISIEEQMYAAGIWERPRIGDHFSIILDNPQALENIIAGESYGGQWKSGQLIVEIRKAE